MKKKRLKIAVHRSKIHGNGVRTIAPIRKGEEVCEYKGRLISHEESDRTYGNEDTGHTFLFILNDEWVVDANHNGNIARWINHGCEPNCEAYIEVAEGDDRSKDRVIIAALRNIRKGEELTYDYDIEVPGPITAKERALWACHCGSPRCVGSMIKLKRAKPVRRARNPAKAKEKAVPAPRPALIAA